MSALFSVAMIRGIHRALAERWHTICLGEAISQ